MRVVPFRAAAAIALLSAAVVRLAHAPSVFRDGVLFPGNDAWHYHHRTDLLLDTPDSVVHMRIALWRSGEPLYYWLLAAWAQLFGSLGVDVALALLPVVLAVATVAVVGWVALELTDDRRVSVLAMFALATSPGHARYSVVGNIDHHAFSVFLFALMVAGVVGLSRAAGSDGGVDGFIRRWQRSPDSALTVGAAAGLAMLAWSGAPVFLLALGAAWVVGSVWWPGEWVFRYWLLFGLLFGSVITLAVHWLFGWQGIVSVLAPGLLLVALGSLEAAREVGQWRWAGAGGAAAGGLLLAVPGLGGRLRERVVEDLVGRGGIVEASSMLEPQAALQLVPLWYLGPVLVLSPAIGYVVWQLAREDFGWAILAGMLAAMAALTVVQVRFAAALSVVLAPATAAAIVVVLSEMGVVQPLGEGELSLRAGNGLDVVVFVGGFLAASAVVSVVAGGALVVDDQQRDVAKYIDARAGVDAYVLTEWGDARLYNSLVADEGDSYAFAQKHYAAVVTGDRPPPARVDWVVVDERTAPPGYRADWHAADAERVYETEHIEVYRVE